MLSPKYLFILAVVAIPAAGTILSGCKNKNSDQSYRIDGTDVTESFVQEVKGTYYRAGSQSSGAYSGGIYKFEPNHVFKERTYTSGEYPQGANLDSYKENPGDTIKLRYECVYDSTNHIETVRAFDQPVTQYHYKMGTWGLGPYGTRYYMAVTPQSYNVVSTRLMMSKQIGTFAPGTTTWTEKEVKQKESGIDLKVLCEQQLAKNLENPVSERHIQFSSFSKDLIVNGAEAKVPGYIGMYVNRGKDNVEIPLEIAAKILDLGKDLNVRAGKSQWTVTDAEMEIPRAVVAIDAVANVATAYFVEQGQTCISFQGILTGVWYDFPKDRLSVHARNIHATTPGLDNCRFFKKSEKTFLSFDIDSIFTTYSRRLTDDAGEFLKTVPSPAK